MDIADMAEMAEEEEGALARLARGRRHLSLTLQQHHTSLSARG
jgi:hypothetical protein